MYCRHFIDEYETKIGRAKISELVPLKVLETSLRTFNAHCWVWGTHL